MRLTTDETTYELTTVSLGAGVQSSTIVEMIVEGELPSVDVVHFADTGDEPQHVYDQVEYLRGRLATVNIPLVTVSNGNMVDDIYSGGRFAAMPLFTKQIIPIRDGVSNIQIGRLKRQCTTEYKIVPIERWIREELLRRGLARQYKNGAIHIKKGVRVCQWLGISFDEMQRMKPNQIKWIDNAWPLIDLRMKRHHCIEWLKARSLPVPKKSSCKRCPYHNKLHYRQMRDETPGDWQEIILFDNDLRNGKLRLSATAAGDLYLTDECIPLGEIDLSTPQENGQTDLFDLCDEGHCFI
jgi:hypothetical protein